MYRDEEHKLLLQALNCALGGKRATYVSGPITTGPSFIDWYLSTGFSLEEDTSAYHASRQRCVLTKNEAAIIELAEVLRVKSGKSVIEPASLRIRTWEQRHYHQFWTDVLRLYASEIVAIDGWQYSIGCAVEFKYAVHLGLNFFSAQGRRITVSKGANLIKSAAEDLQKRAKGNAVLQHMAQKLAELSGLSGVSRDDNSIS